MSPAYSASSALAPLDGLYPGDSKTVWSAEQPATGTKSQAVALATGFTPYSGPIYVSVELKFAAAPGAFTIEVQGSDTEADANYVSEGFGGNTPGQITTVNATTFAARVELLVKCKFLRLSSVLQNANAVNLTAKISR
jgi:hypothetical protein